MHQERLVELEDDREYLCDLLLQKEELLAELQRELRAKNLELQERHRLQQSAEARAESAEAEVHTYTWPNSLHSMAQECYK